MPGEKERQMGHKSVRVQVAALLMFGLAGCGDDGCPPLGSNPSGIVNTTAIELSGDCGAATNMEISNGLITLDGCFLDPADGPSADSCDEAISVVCEDEFGGFFGWLGTVSYIGDSQFQGELRLRVADSDRAPLCESYYLVTYTER
jgi:hypothetical protein